MDYDQRIHKLENGSDTAIWAAKQIKKKDIEMSNYAEVIETLEDLVKVQCSHGNWNYDPYMHGMANGMILALSLFQGGTPEYLEAPNVWLKDTTNNEKTTCGEEKT